MFNITIERNGLPNDNITSVKRTKLASRVKKWVPRITPIKLSRKMG